MLFINEIIEIFLINPNHIIGFSFSKIAKLIVINNIFI